ncbi:MAG: enoyl-CoA hydratase/isomerase family protein [Planctomycetes bacterium]|nr:enoyl-CoA hydratase/isomerase family protein [Planctomycetota bacterium]
MNQIETMIEDPLAGVPMPPGAPEPGACIRYENPEPGLVRLVLDPPHRSMPVFDVPVLRDLAAAIRRVEGEGSLRGLVICGRDPLVFAAGADLDAIGSIETPEAVARYISFGQSLFQRIYKLSREGGGSLMVVAAIGGAVPGGAYEIALACDRIVLVDHDKSRVGLPEVKLGIVPGWGGCARLPRRAGVPTALDVILNGKLVRARKALKLGMVDRMTKPEYLERIAADIAMGRMPCRRARRGRNAWLVDKNPLALAIIGRTAAKAVHKATGGHYPAPRIALELVLAAPRESLGEALAAERRVNSTLATNPITKSLVGIYHMSEAAKGLAKGADGEKAAAFTRGAVIGAGVMGGAIASLCAERGFELRLRDLSRDALDAAVRGHQAEILKKRKRR